MNLQAMAALAAANQAIIQYRGIYARWTALHRINYHEMLVLYTIRDSGFCTQKQISEDFHLPPQTVHNVISRMRREGILQVSPELQRGREKALILTEKGREYARPMLEEITAFEDTAIANLGLNQLLAMTQLVEQFNQALQRAMANTALIHREVEEEDHAGNHR